jgi:hypothetical protein
MAINLTERTSTITTLRHSKISANGNEKTKAVVQCKSTLAAIERWGIAVRSSAKLYQRLHFLDISLRRE